MPLDPNAPDVADLEEGDPCPNCGDGDLQTCAGRDCSCHINPPCSSCIEDGLRCDFCSWRLGDGLPEVADA